MTKKVEKEILSLINGKSVNQVHKRLCGELLGKGVYRDVYVFKKYPEYVIKIERDMTRANFANVTEFRNYIQNQDWTFLSDWLAPCELINQTGSILIQERVYWDGKRRKDYPMYVPGIFTDLKLKNFGWTKKGQFVCCDYSFMTTYIITVGKNKMRYAKWWGSLKN